MASDAHSLCDHRGCRICVCVTSDLVCNLIVVCSFMKCMPYDRTFNRPILDDLETDYTRPLAISHDSIYNLVKPWVTCHS